MSLMKLGVYYLVSKLLVIQ